MQRSFLAPPPTRAREPAARPSFSVVVAAYQVADVIGEALDSVLGQTLEPLEIIVCDDGSTDDLEAAVAPVRDRIVFLQKPHGGEGSAKNAAAAAARGDFIVILDADDVYLPDRLEALTELACSRPDLDILTTDAYLVVEGRRIRRNYDRRWPFEAVHQRRAILQRNFVFGHAAVRRERFLQHGGFDESILWTTDWDLWLRLILDGSAVGMVDLPLALYRVHEGGLTSRRRDLLLGKIATLEKATRNRQLTADERPLLDQTIAVHRRELALADLRVAVAGDASDARERALEVLRQASFPLRNRLEAAAILTLPGVCRRFFRRRAVRSWIGAGGTRVSRAPARAKALRRLLSRATGARIR